MAARGWQVVPEPGRRIVAGASGPGDPVLPWNDIAAFARAALKLAAADWDAAAPGITLYDRGVIDAVLGLRRAGAADPDAEAALTRCPYDEVFLAPPWPELFVQDAGRRHGFDAAMEEYMDIETHLEGTARLLPKLPPEDRADWLEAALGAGERAA